MLPPARKKVPLHQTSHPLPVGSLLSATSPSTHHTHPAAAAPVPREKRHTALNSLHPSLKQTLTPPRWMNRSLTSARSLRPALLPGRTGYAPQLVEGGQKDTKEDNTHTQKKGGGGGGWGEGGELSRARSVDGWCATTRGGKQSGGKHSLCHGRIKGCPCRRMLQFGRQHQQQQQHLREREGGREGGGREGEADDVKRFKSFRSPLHDMWPPTQCIIHPACFLVLLLHLPGWAAALFHFHWPKDCYPNSFI